MTRSPQNTPYDDPVTAYAQAVIDGVAVNGSARFVGWFAGVVRTVQTGLLNQYAIAMIVGIALLLAWFIPVLTRR